MARPLSASIDLAVILKNYLRVQQLHPSGKTMAVIKADAYGHGSVQVAHYLQEHVDAFAVATIEEALELRDSGVLAPILLLEGCFENIEIQTCVEQSFWMVVHDQKQLSWLEEYAQTNRATLESKISVWLKVDTGMRRLGIAPVDTPVFLQRLQALSCVKVDVLMSHLSCADELDSHKTLEQTTQFEASAQGWKGLKSLANSAAVSAWPETYFDWLRPGLMLYGGSPFAHQKAMDVCEPAMTLTTRIIAIRDVNVGESVGYGAAWTSRHVSRIATLAVGYADGYPRHAGEGACVWLHGRRAEIAGRVSMDMMMIDLVNHPEAQVGDHVELWGRNLSINEVAKFCHTIPYTLFTGLGKRVKRDYISQ